MLQGIRVLDLTRYLPGPYATRLLRDLGAEVVKIEGPAAPDPLRSWPPLDEAGVGHGYRALNRGKRHVALDLKSERGRELLLDLVDHADVLVEGFRPGTLERLGLSPEACRARNPRLVFASISGYGQDGPYRDRPGHDLNYLATSGALGAWSDPAGGVALPGLQVADLLGAHGALVGILAALLGRERGGPVRQVDASMLDAVLSAQVLELAPADARTGAGGGAPAVPDRRPLSGRAPCYRLYATADGRSVALGALEPKFWRAFCEAVERKDWIPRQFDEALVPEVAELFRSASRATWCARLEQRDVCFSPVLDYDELADDPQVSHRLGAEEGLPSAVRFAPPAEPASGRHDLRLGAHTHEVLEGVLGLAPEEVQDLTRRGVAACPA